MYSIDSIYNFIKRLHPTNQLKSVISAYEKKDNRNDEDDELLSEFQRTFNWAIKYQKYSMAEIINRYEENEILMKKNNDIIELFYRENRSDEEDYLLTRHQYLFNVAAWDDVQRQIDRGWDY